MSCHKDLLENNVQNINDLGGVELELKNVYPNVKIQW